MDRGNVPPGVAVTRRRLNANLTRACQMGQHKAKQGEPCMPTTSHLRNLTQALGSWRRALEEFESALLELEGTPDENGDAPKRSPNGQNRQNLRLLSLAEVCQELGEQRTVVYRRLSSGVIPSLKLGHALKVRQADLQEYINGQRRNRSLGEKNGPL